MSLPRLSPPVPPTASALLEIELAAVARRPFTPLWKLRESACAFVDAEKLAGRHAQAIVSDVRQMATRAGMTPVGARDVGAGSLGWTSSAVDEMVLWCIERYVRHSAQVDAPVTDTLAVSDTAGARRWQDDGGAQ
jgi:hypothetical protein